MMARTGRPGKPTGLTATGPYRRAAASGPSLSSCAGTSTSSAPATPSNWFRRHRRGNKKSALEAVPGALLQREQIGDAASEVRQKLAAIYLVLRAVAG